MIYKLNRKYNGHHLYKKELPKFNYQTNLENKLDIAVTRNRSSTHGEHGTLIYSLRLVKDA